MQVCHIWWGIIVEVYRLSAGERMKTKDVSQWVTENATPPSPVASESFWISSDVTKGGDHVADLDTEDIDEDVELFAAIGTKMNSWKWVKKDESQVGELDQLELKVIVLHDDREEEVHMKAS